VTVPTKSSRRDPFPYPLDLVVGVLAHDEAVGRVREALTHAGFAEDRV
jgi:hypothetical protein